MDRTEALFVISQLMSTGKVIIFEDAKKKAFLQEAQIMKDFRGQIGFGRLFWRFQGLAVKQLSKGSEV